MKSLLLFSFVSTIAILSVIFFSTLSIGLSTTQPSVEPVGSFSIVGSIDLGEGDYIPLFRTVSHEFICIYPEARGSTQCQLAAVDLIGTASTTRLPFKSERPTDPFQLFPSGASLAVIGERHLDLVDTRTLKSKTVSRLAEDKIYGVLTGYPQFIPCYSWNDRETLKIGVYRRSEQTGIKTCNDHPVDTFLLSEQNF